MPIVSTPDRERVGNTTIHPAGTPASVGALREIVRRWPVVLLVALAAVAAGAIASSSRESSYTARARLVIIPLAQQNESFLGTSLLRDAGDANRTASTLATTMDSREVERETAERLGDDWTADAVHDAVSVKPVANANVVEIEATAASSTLASRVASSFAEATLDVRWDKIAAELEERISALDQLTDTVSDAGGLARDREILAATLRAGTDPTLRLQGNAPRVSQEGVSTAVVLVLALAGGLLLGCLAALGLSRLGRRIHSEQDVAGTYPLPVLARVRPDALLRMAEVLGALPRQDAFAGVAQRIQRALPKGGTIAVASPSAGDGRSPCAASVAAALAADERTATVLDIGAEPATGDDIVRLVARARRRANFVVVDGPPLGDEPRALKACVVADVCLLVVRIGHTERQDLRRARGLLDRTGVQPAGLVVVDAGPGRRANPPLGDEAANGQPTAPADVVAIDR